MLKNQSISLALKVGVACFFAITAHAQTTGKQCLHGHLPEAVARFHLQPTGRLSATQHLNLAIGLPLRNETALDSLLQQLYDPASPNFRQYLTPEQFTERFGPTEQDYQAIVDFAKANGLTVTGTLPNRMVVDVRGPVANIEKAFHVTMRTYRHPEETRDFYAPDAEPSLDLSVAILHVSGLNNYSLKQPANLTIKAVDPNVNPSPNSGSGPSGSYRGNDFRAAYVPGVTTNQLSGAGQSIALVEFDGYYSNDIALYESQTGLPSVTLTNILIDGYSGAPSGNANQVTEVSLDIEMVISMAPCVSKVIVYEAPITSTWVDILGRIANDNLARQISCSWSGGGPDDPSETAFKIMATQGQSFFNATGDKDAFTGSVPFPSDSTNITQVGGTTLSTTGPGGAWASETVWNWGGGTGSSGGVSTYYAIPNWQQGINMTSNKGSTTMRNIPDVALTADNIYVISNDGQISTDVGGTSVAAPLWAGFTALVNQQAVTNSQPPVGFINPAVYAIGRGPNYTADFHDITTGNNTWSGSTTKYYAVTGYDLCTGWGTPNGIALINALAIPDGLVSTPVNGFTANGVTGGPFDRASQIFALTNSGASSLNWSLINPSVWLGASSSGGTLGVGSQSTVTIKLNAAASNLVAGIYPATLTFSNQSSHVPQSLLFTLQSGQSFLQNGGFETGSFNNWTLAGNGIIGTTIYNAVISAGSLNGNGGTNFIHSGTYGAFLGDNQIATLSQTVNTFPGQGYLLSFWLANPVGGSVQQFLVNWNTNSSGTNQIYYILNPPVLPWTNITMVVTATGTNTTLQFGAENEPDGFGLDDITLTPIPVPSFRSVGTSNHAIAFTWNSLTSIVYQVQYSTNLTRTNWTILSTNTATGSILTLTNSYGTDRQRFYRIRRLP
jgi:subtilase family serine protease